MSKSPPPWICTSVQPGFYRISACYVVMAQMLCTAFLFLFQHWEICAILIINLLYLSFITYIFFNVFYCDDKWKW